MARGAPANTHTEPPQHVGLALRVRAARAHALTKQVLALFAARDIRAAPLKGALLNAVIYSHSPPCPVGDVDLLVSPDDAPAAESALHDDGATCVGRQAHASTWSLGGDPLLVDLHRHLVDPRWFQLDTRQILGRATLDTTRFAPAPALMLAAEDVYVHLVADFAKSRRGRLHIERLADLRVWARHHGLDPVTVARRLAEGGVARAARYVLGLAARNEGDAFAAAVLAALPDDAVGRAMAALARWHMGQRADGHWSTVLWGHALNSDWPSGLRSLAASVRDSLSRD